MTQLDSDIESARNWLVGIGADLLKVADLHDALVASALDKINLIAACAQLSGDMPLRVRLCPNVFKLLA